MNIPEVKLGMVAVSRDCFPMSLSQGRAEEVVKAFKAAGGELFRADTIVENERDAVKALDELRQADCNALVVYLGNFGPEGPETMLAKKFCGPAMFAAAAEENMQVLAADRGDAYCGMLNASYNIGLRGLDVYIPEYPVGAPNEVAAMIAEFIPVARALIGLSKLKVFGFGPRPFDFLACNAPIKPLYDLGVEVQENSELDLYMSFKAHAGDKRIEAVIADMEKELGEGNKMPGVLPKLAQYELTLLDWLENNIGACEYAVFANKCWPAFEHEFGFVPCYVNSRLADRLMPVACETDIYGALSEYIISCVTETPPTLLDINNTVPPDIYDADIKGAFGYAPTDVFMGFHCGNTPARHLENPIMKYQLIMHRLNEPGKEPDITRGTLEGDLKAGRITLFRLQGAAEGGLRSYIAEGEILPVKTRSFGGIGVIAVPEMARFYRHVLIEKRYPHHAGIAFAHAGKPLFSIMKLLGVPDVAYNKPKGDLYCTENPFCG